MAKVLVSNKYKSLRNDVYKTIKRKRQRTIVRTFTILILFITMLVLFILLISPNAFGSAEEQQPVRVTVRTGDCLWNIARDFSEEKDIRQVIYEIRKYNNLEGNQIYPGMVLWIPTC